jgi:hypothetical protein
MMEDGKIEIWASVGITKNLGNYESLRLDAGARITADNVEDPSVWEKLWNAVDEQIESKLKELDK